MYTNIHTHIYIHLYFKIFYVLYFNNYIILNKIYIVDDQIRSSFIIFDFQKINVKIMKFYQLSHYCMRVNACNTDNIAFTGVYRWRVEYVPNR